MRLVTKAMTLAALIALPVGVSAQEAPQAPTQERTLNALTAQPAAAERARSTVSSFLDRADVKKVAEDHGIDLQRLREGVATLDDDAAADLARRVETADQQLAHVGGDTFVISSTVVIIALLVIILVIVA